MVEDLRNVASHINNVQRVPNMQNATIAPDTLNRKTDLAKRFQCSTRQIELMVNDGRLPRPFYIGNASPRWRQSDIDAWLNKLAADAQENAGGAQ